MSQQRNHYRIPFPIRERPSLAIRGVELDVLDLSERGARVALDRNSPCLGKDPMPVSIRFRDGTSAKTTAVVHRREYDRLVLRFTPELPFAVIAAEQRRLLKLFPRGAVENDAAAFSAK